MTDDKQRPVDDGLHDKVAIVTGTGSPSGIGWATALALADRGVRLVAADIGGRPDLSDTALHGGVNELVSEIRNRDGQAIAVDVDITDRKQIARCLDEAGRFGPINILVNNAGTTAGARASAATPSAPASWL